jgi:hypothetical protein
MSLVMQDDVHEPVWAELPKRPAPPEPDPIEQMKRRRSKRKCTGRLIGRRYLVCGTILIQRPDESDASFAKRHLCAGRHADETPALLRPVRLRAAGGGKAGHRDVLEADDTLTAKAEQVDQFARETAR